MKVIETNKLTKSYGSNKAIDELKLDVEQGDFFGFIGPNGAGKSTTIRTLLGLIKADSGNAKVLGFDIVTDKKKILAQTGYLPSEINFYNKMKVEDVIKYSASLRRTDCMKKARDLSERLALDLSKNVDELSLGNRKKVGIICAVMHSPKLLILDEPTSGLDPLMQREFFNILNEENKNGSTIFFSSHILSEVQTNCKSAAFIKNGKIIMSDKVENIEQTGTKKISVLGDVNVEQIKNIPGVSAMEEAEGGYKTFFYNGDLNQILNVLNVVKIKDITITEPSLEEIFMNYYE